MTKKRKTRSVNRENRSPLMKFKLNQEIKAVESRMSEEEREAFRKLPPSEKRDVVLSVSKQQAEDAIDDEIFDYFKRLNASNHTTDIASGLSSAQPIIQD